MLRTPASFVPAIRAVLKARETVSTFIRAAAEREIGRRKGEKL